MAREAVTLRTLIELVSADASSAAQHLARVYEWRYAERSALAKALVGGGFALILAPLVPLIQPEVGAPPSSLMIVALYVCAAVLVVTGAIIQFRSRTIHREYLAAQALLGRLIEIRPFIRLAEANL